MKINLFSPKSKDEDQSRREFILNILLSGVIILSSFAFFLALLNFLSGPDIYRGASVMMLLIILSLFCFLFYLSRKGKFIISSYFLISLLFLGAFYTSLNWGIELPTVIVTYSLIILISGILVSIKFSIFITAFTSIVYIGLGHLQSSGITHPELYWKQEMITSKDPIFLVVMFWVIQILTWLSYREIEKSLKRARRSEKELKKERDLLEIRVEERTKELKRTQLEKTAQLAELAEFGRLASGIVHDLANPLTSILLGLEDLRRNKNSTSETAGSIKLALDASKKMENFIKAIKKQLQKQEVKKLFNVNQEISQVMQVLSYRAHVAKVEISLINNSEEKIMILGNPMKFSQMVSNILINSIDACENIENAKVVLTLNKYKDNIKIIIKDNGCGVKKEIVEKVFDPFFTTKNPEKGTGLGLSIVKGVVENDFDGKIKMFSEVGKGTEISIGLPIRQDEAN